MCFGDLVADRQRFDRKAWQGRRVALTDVSQGELLRLLVLLDGTAEVILVVPPELNELTRQRFCNELAIDTVIGSNAVAPETVRTTSAPVLTDADDHGMTPIPTRWILATSGTTGTPKLIAHTIASLTRGMYERDLSGEFVWGSLYQPRRFAGLQVFLQAWLSGTPLILAAEREAMTNYVQRLHEAKCNAVSATPSLWRKLAMCPGFEALPLRQITLGGETVDQPVLDLLRRTFPGARIVHIYASTEAGVGFAVQDGLAGFPAAYLDMPPRGVAIRIDSEGRMWLQPHESPPTPLTGDVVDPNGWIDSGDIVRQTGDRVHFLGRASGSINVGGNKVMPEEVERIIQEIPGVAFVMVRGRRNPLLGNLVEAHVASAPGWLMDDAFRKSIIDYCRVRLEPYKVPAFVKPLDEVEINAAGKISRREAA